MAARDGGGMISVAAVRAAAGVVCAAGTVGMIVSSVLGHNGAAITFGLAAAFAVGCSMVATAVTVGVEPGGASPATDREREAREICESLAELVERQVQAAVTEGASEQTVRRLVGEAVRLGRTLGSPALPSVPLREGEP